MAAPGWKIENYNAFLREARAEWDLSLSEARELYREVRNWKTAPAYGAPTAPASGWYDANASNPQNYGR